MGISKTKRAMLNEKTQADRQNKAPAGEQQNPAVLTDEQLQSVSAGSSFEYIEAIKKTNRVNT